MRDRTPLPARIANAPELYLGLEMYYSAFLDLTTCRGQGYGTEGPVSWFMMDQYARRNRIRGEQREDLLYHVAQMDKVYLDFKAKKLENTMKSSKAAKKPMRKR